MHASSSDFGRLGALKWKTANIMPAFLEIYGIGGVIRGLSELKSIPGKTVEQFTQVIVAKELREGNGSTTSQQKYLVKLKLN